MRRFDTSCTLELWVGDGSSIDSGGKELDASEGAGKDASDGAGKDASEGGSGRDGTSDI